MTFEEIKGEIEVHKLDCERMANKLRAMLSTRIEGVSLISLSDAQGAAATIEQILECLDDAVGHFNELVGEDEDEDETEDAA